MRKILIIGGYGGFGGRLSRRLMSRGHRVLVGGRSVQKAKAFCGGGDRCCPIQIDRGGDVSAVLAVEQPDLVIDASGPFQHNDYRLIEACIDARIPYVDLADAREFVTGIERFDESVRRSGIAVLSGASSVPALSHAVVAELAAELDQVTAIEIAISASSRASAGVSVARAILGGIGRPVRLWAGGRWQRGHGWQSIRLLTFALQSGMSLGRRWVGLVDVPDLSLLPRRYPGVSSVTFRAGTESGLANLILWLASWPVRWGWFASLSGLSGLLSPAQRLTALWGGDRSGMSVRLFGHKGHDRLERRWTLIANDGDGPEIPVLAAELLAERILRGEVDASARDAGDLLSLADFEPLFGALSIQHEIARVPQPPALYHRIMGPDFDRLAPALKSMHGVLRDHGATGQAVVERGRHPFARLIAGIMRFPPPGDHALHVHFSEEAGRETWTRDFGGRRFSSVLSADGAQLVERFGPLRFRFELNVADSALAMKLTGWALGPIPLPNILAPRSPAREWQEDGLFHFDVPIDLPLIGRVVRYRGWLSLDMNKAAAAPSL